MPTVKHDIAELGAVTLSIYGEPYRNADGSTTMFPTCNYNDSLRYSLNTRMACKIADDAIINAMVYAQYRKDDR